VPAPEGLDTGQREFVRARTALAIRVTAHGERPTVTQTVDLSASGALLSAGPFAIDTRVDFCIEPGGGQRPIQGQARVVRIDSAGRPALAFEHISVEDHERLVALITRHATPTRSALSSAA